jgi:hypothetical protein
VGGGERACRRAGVPAFRACMRRPCVRACGLRACVRAGGPTAFHIPALISADPHRPVLIRAPQYRRGARTAKRTGARRVLSLPRRLAARCDAARARAAPPLDLHVGLAMRPGSRAQRPLIVGMQASWKGKTWAWRKAASSDTSSASTPAAPNAGAPLWVGACVQRGSSLSISLLSLLALLPFFSLPPSLLSLPLVSQYFLSLFRSLSLSPVLSRSLGCSRSRSRSRAPLSSYCRPLVSLSLSPSLRLNRYRESAQVPTSNDARCVSGVPTSNNARCVSGVYV